jgi:hypothetical protein
VADPTSAIIDAIAKLDPRADRVHLTDLIAEWYPSRRGEARWPSNKRARKGGECLKYLN